MRKPQQGSLLVARPALLDPNFRHAVILLFRHEDESGSMGLIVNRPSKLKVASSVGSMAGAEKRDDRLWIGGPVQQNSVWVLHRRPDLDDRGIEVVPGLFLGGSPALLRDLLLTTGVNPAPTVFRVVRGYAGWGEGQLKSEIDEGAWRVTDAVPEIIFGAEAEDLWDDVLTRAQLPFALPHDALRNARHN
jgi:putative transcriptional regulator